MSVPTMAFSWGPSRLYLVICTGEYIITQKNPIPGACGPECGTLNTKHSKQHTELLSWRLSVERKLLRVKWPWTRGELGSPCLELTEVAGDQAMVGSSTVRTVVCDSTPWGSFPAPAKMGCHRPPLQKVHFFSFPFLMTELFLPSIRRRLTL